MTKEHLLQKIWECCTFDEIINKGFENGKCSAQNLIDASSEFENPDKEYSDDEIKEIIKTADIDVVIDGLFDKHSLGDILNVLGENNVLQYYDEETLFDYIENSYVLQDYANTLKNEAWCEGYDAAAEQIENSRNSIFVDGQPDDKWCKLCDLFGITYYDKNALKQKLYELDEDLKKSIYFKT